MTIVITGSRRAPEQAALVENLGGVPRIVPTVGIGLPRDDSEIEPFLRELVGPEGADYSVFMTATGVRAILMAAERLGLKGDVVEALNSPRTTVVARSGKPRRELNRNGIKADAWPPLEEATAIGILKLLRSKGLQGKRVSVLWHGSVNGILSEGILASGGKHVSQCQTYRYSSELEPEGAKVLESIGFKYVAPDERLAIALVQDLIEKSGRVDALTFTSPPAVSGLFDIAGEHELEESLVAALNARTDVTIVAVGSSTSDELKAYGVRVDVVPKVAAMGAMMNALADYVRSRTEVRKDQC